MTSTNLSLGKGSFEMQTNESWNIKYFEEDISKAEIRFNNNEYPVLGVKILSFDDPKASIESNLEKYLFDSAAIEINKDIKIYTDIDGSKFIEYEAVLDSGERVKVYRKVKFIGSRTVRLVTLGLSWLENKKSIPIINKILKEIDVNFKNLTFPEILTPLDEEANIQARLKKIKYKNLKLWDDFSFYLPSSWRYELDKENKNLVARVVGFEEAMLFIDGERSALPDKFKTSSEYIQAVSSFIKNDENINNLVLNSTSNETYLISCKKKEFDKEEEIYLEHYFWHYFVYRNNVFEKLNFTFVFPEKKDNFLYYLPDIIDNSVKSIKL